MYGCIAFVWIDMGNTQRESSYIGKKTFLNFSCNLLDSH